MLVIQKNLLISISCSVFCFQFCFLPFCFVSLFFCGFWFISFFFHFILFFFFNRLSNCLFFLLFNRNLPIFKQLNFFVFLFQSIFMFFHGNVCFLFITPSIYSERSAWIKFYNTLIFSLVWCIYNYSIIQVIISYTFIFIMWFRPKQVNNIKVSYRIVKLPHANCWKGLFQNKTLRYVKDNIFRHNFCDDEISILFSLLNF